MFKFYMHGGSGNHGCEAIVRSSIGILKKSVTLFSMNPEQDLRYNLDKVCKIELDDYCYYRRGSIKWLVAAVHKRLSGYGDMATKFIRGSLINQVHEGDICFSVGGDNYCYPGLEELASINRNMKKNGARLVLWGCSVEPEVLKRDDVREDIQQFDLITARESISYEALKCVNPNTMLVTDPAFALEKVELPLPKGWIDGKMIGINASPLILQNGKDGEMVLEAYHRLIERILESTDFKIALIPHVVMPKNDDREVLNRLYDVVEKKERIVLVPDCNCMELKGYISRCRMFIGARTHATIAAYSSCIPTLVLGYSVKSRGIAKDIFGTCEKYVLPVQSLSNPVELADGFEWLMKNEKNIKEHLESFMPEYIKRTHIANKAVERLID